MSSPNRRILFFPSIPASIFLFGCLTPRMDIEELKRLRPGPAPELERLNMLAGHWETGGEIKLLGLKEPISTKGSNVAVWECDGRFLFDRATLDMGALGPMTGVSVWTWDSTLGKYRMWWFDGFGESAWGTATFHDATKTWRIRTRGQNGRCGLVNHGTIRMVDENTLEWTWRQWDGWHLFKIADMNGTSRRR